MTPDESDPAAVRVSDPLAQLAAPPAFVVGVHRSGTTWVYEMLSAHPEVAGVFESGLFSIDLGFAPLFHPGHWYSDSARLEGLRRFFGSSFRLNQLLEREELKRDVTAMASRWLARALDPNHRYLVEKTPQHVRTMPLIAELFPGAAFIHVIRDGRDVAVSKRAARTWVGQAAPANSFHMGLRWAEAIRTGREHAQSSEVRYMEVRYEDLREDPRTWLSSLFEFCRIPAEADLVAEICDGTKLENRGRRAEPDAFRRRGAVGEWRETFTLIDRLRFDRAAGALLVELGYATDRRWWLAGRHK